MIDWLSEHPWLVEGIVIMAGSFLIGIIVGKAIAWANGDD